MTNAEELLRERAELLERLEVINQALKDLETPTKAVRIYTRRNLRNTYLLGITVYKDDTLTEIQSSAANSGYISAAGASTLRAEGEVDGDFIDLR